MKEKILKFIEENKYMYLNFLTTFEDCFPYVCDYSSEILAGYLHAKYNFPPEICEGSLDGDDCLGHFWIELDDIKIDFTLCQFATTKEKLTNSIKNESIYTLIEELVPFPIITNDNIWYDRLEYLDYVSINKEIINIANNSNDFITYLNNIKQYYDKLLI